MPDDNNTIPLINTIRETTLAAIAKKYNIETAQKRFDISHSQSDSEYITSAIGDYNDTIQDIIDNIPDVPPTPPGPTLPTVWESINYYFNKSASGNYYFADNETKDLFSASGYKISYDDTFSYAVVVCKDTSTNEVRIGIPVVKDDVYLAVKNETGAAISLSYASIRVCSSNQATVVTVYNSQNNPYNAFQYTLDGTDYYYVLDGTQTDWTSDLSSIGYSLTPQNPNAYFTTQGSSASSDFTFRGGTITPVYDAAGNAIPYDSSKTYTKVEVYNYAGQVVSDSLTNGLKFENRSGYLVAVRNWATYDQTTQIYRIEYTVT